MGYIGNRIGANHYDHSKGLNHMSDERVLPDSFYDKPPHRTPSAASTHPYWQLPLRTALKHSVKSLDKIGEGDWTPQDEAHLNLVNVLTRFLASGPQLRTGRIIHGDA